MAALTFKKATSFYLSAGWATLDELALSLILDKLLEPIDHVHCGAVCKQWHSFTKQYRQTRQYCNRKLLPWLMIPPRQLPEGKTTRRRSQIYSISEAKVYDNIDLSLAYYTKRCCGSSHGWLATVDQRLAITLHNPFQKATEPIRLPPLDAFTIPIQNAPLYEYYVSKVVLSADPSSHPDYAVLVICDIGSKLGFIKRGQTHWTYLTNCYGNIFYSDVVFYKDQIYAVGTWGYMVSLDFNSLVEPTVTMLEPTFTTFTYCAVRAYLVESIKGELLHVRRVRFYGRGPMHGIKLHTSEIFEVFKVVFDHKNKSRVELVKLKDIGGQALFLGNNHCFSLLASDYPDQCRPNSIYFTDDLTFFGLFRPLNEGPCDEIGIYDLKDGSVTPYPSLTLNWELRKPPAIWIVPSIN